LQSTTKEGKFKADYHKPAPSWCGAMYGTSTPPHFRVRLHRYVYIIASGNIEGEIHPGIYPWKIYLH
jgi:hypothetical protein